MKMSNIFSLWHSQFKIAHDGKQCPLIESANEALKAMAFGVDHMFKKNHKSNDV